MGGPGRPRRRQADVTILGGGRGPSRMISTVMYEIDLSSPDDSRADQIIELRHTLRYLGVPLATVGGSNASYMFGDNLSVVNSSVLPSGELQK